VTPQRFPQIVLLEGLPGSGKSTTAHLLALHLARHGRAARWFYEHDTPHPIFDRASIDLGLDEGRVPDDFCDQAVRRWRRLAEDVAAADESAVLESALFQLPLHPMLLMDWPEARMAAYLRDVEAALSPARTVPVILRHEHVDAALRDALTWRGEWFRDYLEQRIARSAYGRARGLTGSDGIVRYFTDYRDLTDRLRQHLALPCVVLDAAAPKETLPSRVMAALGLPEFLPFGTDVAPQLFVGNYKDPASDNAMDIVTDGTHLYVDGAFRTRLIQRDRATFEIAGTPVQLAFTANGDGRMEKIDCRANLPDLPREWVRTA
jgi:hypothetical protein